MRAKLYEIARKKTACVFRSVRLPSLFPVTPNSFITVNFYVRARKNMILTLLLSILFCSAKFQIADATSRVESTRHTSRFIHRGFPREKLISFHERLIKNVEGSSKALLNANLTFTKTFYQVLGQNISIWDNDKSFTSDLVAHEINGGEYRLLDMERLRMIRDGDTVLDLGSNVGITAIVVAKMFPTVRVIGVEPVPYNFAAALRNVDENGVADRVTILNAALTRNASSTISPSLRSVTNRRDISGSPFLVGILRIGTPILGLAAEPHKELFSRDLFGIRLRTTNAESRFKSIFSSSFATNLLCHKTRIPR